MIEDLACIVAEYCYDEDLRNDADRKSKPRRWVKVRSPSPSNMRLPCMSLTDQSKYVTVNLGVLDAKCWNNLCQNRARWVKPIIIANLPKLQSEQWHHLCGNRAEWVESIITANLSCLNRFQLYDICINPAEWAGRIISANSRILQEYHWSAVCMNPAEWARLFLDANMSSVRSTISHNPALWACNPKYHVYCKNYTSMRWKMWLEHRAKIISLLQN